MKRHHLALIVLAGIALAEDIRTALQSSRYVKRSIKTLHGA